MTHKDYQNCELCPRRCRVDRSETVGFCDQTDLLTVSRAAPHMWEEPCISGAEGSGTVFFNGCTLGCVFCQNAEISRCGKSQGKIITSDKLADIFIRLCAGGVNNINLVTPTMYSPHIVEAVKTARSRGMTVPVVYNTSGYEREEIIRELAATVDIWLPDFKYLSPVLSEKYSNTADYAEHAKPALCEMVRLTGKPKFDARGIMLRGVIVRHLLLPGLLNESKRVVGYLFAEYGNDIFYSLMNQYTPMSALDRTKFPELSRRVTTYEYDKLIEYALSLGMKNAFIQEGSSVGESFIPSFNGDTIY